MDYNTVIYGSAVGCAEHLISLAPRSLLDFHQYSHQRVNHLKSVNSVNRFTKLKNIGSLYKGFVPSTLGVAFGHVGLFSCYQKSQQATDAFQVSLYGVAGRLCHDVCMVPGDTLRMRCNLLQTSSVVQAYKHIVQTNGYRGFFVGLLPTLSISVPSGIAEFLVMNAYSRCFSDEGIHPYIAGAVAGVASSLFVSPVDTIRTCYQSRGTKVGSTTIPVNASLKDITKLLYHQRGIHGFFRGMWLRTLSASLSYGSFTMLAKHFNLDIKE